MVLRALLKSPALCSLPIPPGGPSPWKIRRLVNTLCRFKLFDAHIKRFNIDLAWFVILRVRVWRVRLPGNGKVPGTSRKSLLGQTGAS